MTGAEHAQKATEHLASIDSNDGVMDLGHAIGSALTLGSALVHAVLALTFATVETAYCDNFTPQAADGWIDAGARLR